MKRRHEVPMPSGVATPGAILAAGAIALSTVAACGAPSPGSDDGAGSPHDISGVATADRAYADAWLTNDADSVMGTLTADAVIVPSGSGAIEGAAAIREFWFPPESAPTTVTAFDVTQVEVGAHGDFGHVRGVFRLAFDYDGSSHETEGSYLSLLERDDAGAWKLTHRMWNDHSRAE